MLIGALIGLATYSILMGLSMSHTQAQVNKHNENRLLVAARGKAKVTVNYTQIVINGVAFTTVGAIFGYFI